MPNYVKYHIAVRLLLLKQHLEANAGRDRIVTRRELEKCSKTRYSSRENDPLCRFRCLG